MHKRMTGRLVMGLCAAVALSGCADGDVQLPGFLQSNAETTTTTASRSSRTVERDVEAPEVFQASDKGLWDGRPSLGGVWVAHPDAKDPERVIIRNTTNAKFVVGVLYKPERSQPGPKIQVSSDAAEALGMLAGQPADLSVTALRREEVSEDAPAETGSDGAETTVAAAPQVESRALDPIAAAAAALDAAENGTSAPATSSSTVAAATAPQPTRSAPASSLSKPYIQIGIFSVEQNANNTAESLRRAGMVPTIKPGKMSGKDFWRVIVGPAGTGAERAQLLKKIKELGFNDAYYVTN
ncbi:SPOR domain-containing protein [Maritimibacter sp. UBA3975]|uniref:SPOR domain-containing protein n=2 Tax=Maritimibacter TaxID=404235 RepID=UPI000C0AFA2C|nr:SPOR domain-containing protein [Maritimibacter sp. UBA3975]MAM60646.1 SPOR domain-containing protein [Maritimibacter sp.]